MTPARTSSLACVGIAGAALRRDRTFVPDDLQALARVLRQPPVVGDNRNAGIPEALP